MKPALVIVGIIVAIVIAGGVSQSMKAKKHMDPGPSRPVSDCVLPGDLHPSMLFSLVNSRSEEVQSEYSAMLGCMVPPGGWTGQITSVSGQTVRLEYGIGLTAYSIVLLMKDPHTLQPGASVTFRGRLDGATSKIVMGNVINRIDLSEGELVK